MKAKDFIKFLEEKEIWQLTRAEYDKKFGKRDTKKHSTVTGRFHPHKSAVETALNQGKPVPKEVLKDYPDLEG